LTRKAVRGGDGGSERRKHRIPLPREEEDCDADSGDKDDNFDVLMKILMM